MRTITFTITALFFLTFSSAQIEIDEISLKLVEIFENTKAIKELTSNKKIVLGQLKDIRLWRQQGVPTAQNEKLEESYTAYAGIMNGIISDIEADLKKISSYKDLKGVRLDKFIKKFEKKYREDMLLAFSIYTNGFLPHFEAASEASQSKGGIIGSILLILEFGDTLFSAIKSLFNNNDSSNKSKDMLIGLAMNLVTKKLTKRLTYPTWQEMDMPIAGNITVPSAVGFSELAPKNSSLEPISRTSQSTSPNLFQKENLNENLEYTKKSRAVIFNEDYNQNTAKTQNIPSVLNKSISMKWYGSDNIIPLNDITKGIIVGNATEETNVLKLFSTAVPMAPGDKFWVTLQGKQHTQFYYFDEHLQEWQDPFGKGIIVGGNSHIPTENISVNLPSDTSYFEITDDTEQEHFLILVSDTEISEEIKHSITNKNLVGVSFLKALELDFPISYATLNEQNQLELPTPITGLGVNLHAIYISIDKSKVH